MSTLRYHIPLLSLFLAGTPLSANADTPASIPFSAYEEPKFPAALALTPVLDGYATIAFTTDSTGRVDDAVIIAASHPAFGESVLSVTERWQIKADGANDRREILLYEFRRHGAIISLNQRDSTLAVFSPSLDGQPAIRTVNWRELSPPPARLVSPNPKYPAQLRAQQTTGSATVNFVIDQKGIVRVPVITSADHPDFGAASLEAIKLWRFEPAVLNGTLVNVEAERRFTFGTPR